MKKMLMSMKYEDEKNCILSVKLLMWKIKVCELYILSDSDLLSEHYNV